MNFKKLVLPAAVLLCLSYAKAQINWIRREIRIKRAKFAIELHDTAEEVLLRPQTSVFMPVGYFRLNTKMKRYLHQYASSFKRRFPEHIFEYKSTGGLAYHHLDVELYHYPWGVNKKDAVDLVRSLATFLGRKYEKN